MPESEQAAGASARRDERAEAASTDFRRLQEALLEDQVRLLVPSEAIQLPADARVREAIGQMVAHRRSAVLIVDASGCVVGIFTERDALARVTAPKLDPDRTRLADVMTPDPEALRPDDRICYAVGRMRRMGYRTMPLVDEEQRPIGILTANDIVVWLAENFPETATDLGRPTA